MSEEIRTPARYVGNASVLLRQANGPYANEDGSPRDSLVLHPGEAVQIYGHEAWGYTQKWDTSGNAQPMILGYGEWVLSQDAEAAPKVSATEEPRRSAEEFNRRLWLEARGYEFVLPRADFQAIHPAPEADTEALAKYGYTVVRYSEIDAYQAAQEAYRQAAQSLTRAEPNEAAPGAAAAADAPAEEPAQEVEPLKSKKAKSDDKAE